MFNVVFSIKVFCILYHTLLNSFSTLRRLYTFQLVLFADLAFFTCSVHFLLASIVLNRFKEAVLNVLAKILLNLTVTTDKPFRI